MLIRITVLAQAHFGCVQEDKTKTKQNNKQTEAMSYNNINVTQK